MKLYPYPLLNSKQAVHGVMARLLEQLERLKRDFAQDRYQLAEN